MTDELTALETLKVMLEAKKSMVKLYEDMPPTDNPMVMKLINSFKSLTKQDIAMLKVLQFKILQERVGMLSGNFKKDKIR